jgi:predicted amidohydrolase YtcJ
MDPATKKIDLKGKTVLPGFIDSHVLGTSLGKDLFRINLRGVKSINAIKQKIKKLADVTAEGQWIVGRGWDQDKLVEKRYPVCSDLDEVAPNHPVLLIRVCGHLGVVNSLAMKLARIDKKTKAPQGGRIDRDPVSGQPNGILRENSLKLIFQTTPRSSEANLKELCLFACERMVKEGITTAHWIIDSLDEIRVLQQLRNSESLPLRVNVIVPVNQLAVLQKLGYVPRFGDEKMRLGSVKIFTDGSLGARTAALLEPYYDAPGTKGILLYSYKKLGQLVEKVVEADLQLVIHAIGDRAIEVALKLLEEAMLRTPKMKHRHRIEHVSVLNLKLLKKMKKLGIIASVQPHFVVSDSWIKNRLGPDLSGPTH